MTVKIEQLAAQDASKLETVRSKASVDAGSPPREVLRRKTKIDAPSIAADVAAVKDPTTQASLIASAWRGGVDALIDAGILMMESLRAFANDADQLDAFITGLVDVHLLTPREARLRLVSPKLVKLRAIGECADFLRRKEIAPYLGPGYSTVYQLIVLYRTLPEGDDEQRVKRLLGILENCPGEITRDYLSEETDHLKQSQKASKSKREAQPATSGQTAIDAAADGTAKDLADTSQQVDLVLLTPRERDLKRLATNYADDDTLKTRLPLVQALQQSDNLAAVVVARELDLPLIVDRLLPLCGFGRPSRILLAQQPKSLDVTDAEIVVIAERGESMLSLPGDGVWLDDAGKLNPLAVATRLYPEATRKLHLFAPARTEGWRSIIGDDTWAEEQSR